MLRWIYESYSFWRLACYACGSCNGWRISFFSWRSNSFVAIASCRECGAKQFFKKHHYPHTGKKQIPQWEFEVLRHLGGEGGHQPYSRVPRVYSFASTTRALSMEYLPGESLEKRMRLAKHRQAFDDCLRISACWLQELHGAPPINDKTGSDIGKILRRLESDCGPLASRKTMVAQALVLMRCCLDKINALPIKYVPLHGDFKPSNLIWTPEGVYGIDIGLRFKNSGLMDVAQFISNVRLNLHNVPTIEYDQDVALILDTFLEAYGDNSQQNIELTAWWLLYFLLSQWQDDLEGWKPSRFVDQKYVAALANVLAFCKKNFVILA